MGSDFRALGVLAFAATVQVSGVGSSTPATVHGVGHWTLGLRWLRMKKKVMKTIQISKHLVGVYQMAYRSMMCGCALCSVHGCTAA